jgi:hypothetical protein
MSHVCDTEVNNFFFLYFISKGWLTACHDLSHSTIFLGEFAKFRNATVSFCMSVRLSVPMEHLGFHLKDFKEILYSEYFSKKKKKKN